MSEVNNEVVEELRKFNGNFSKLQSELSIAKRVNTELTKRIVTLERQCWASECSVLKKGMCGSVWYSSPSR